MLVSDRNDELNMARYLCVPLGRNPLYMLTIQFYGAYVNVLHSVVLANYALVPPVTALCSLGR